MSKKAAKKSRKKSAKTGIEADIRAAVHSIPTLIAEQMEWSEEAAPDIDHTQAALERYHANKGKRRVLWIGVLSMTAIVLGMWFWNTQAVFTDMKHAKSAEETIVRNASVDVEKIFASFAAQTAAQEERDAALNEAEEERLLKASIRSALIDQLRQPEEGEPPTMTDETTL